MAEKAGQCKVDAIVSIDAKGQIVLPKDLRDKGKLKQNDKLAVIGYERDRESFCIMMVKAAQLGNTVKIMLGPSLKKIFK